MPSKIKLTSNHFALFRPDPKSYLDIQHLDHVERLAQFFKSNHAGKTFISGHDQLTITADSLEACNVKTNTIGNMRNPLTKINTLRLSAWIYTFGCDEVINHEA